MSSAHLFANVAQSGQARTYNRSERNGSDASEEPLFGRSSARTSGKSGTGIDAGKILPMLFAGLVSGLANGKGFDMNGFLQAFLSFFPMDGETPEELLRAREQALARMRSEIGMLPEGEQSQYYRPEVGRNAPVSARGKELLNDPAFMAKLHQTAEKIGADPRHLLAVMRIESGVNPGAVNPTSGATGLIQFMPKTARGLGTSTEALRNMSAMDQLDYVAKYYAPYRGKLNSVEDLYLATFYPAALGKRDSVALPWKVKAANPVIDQNGGALTVGDVRAFARRKYGG